MRRGIQTTSRYSEWRVSKSAVPLQRGRQNDVCKGVLLFALHKCMTLDFFNIKRFHTYYEGYTTRTQLILSTVTWKLFDIVQCQLHARTSVWDHSLHFQLEFLNGVKYWPRSKRNVVQLYTSKSTLLRKNQLKHIDRVNSETVQSTLTTKFTWKYPIWRFKPRQIYVKLTSWSPNQF